MQIVRQRTAGDCLIAALATVLGVSYEDSAALIGFDLRGGIPVDVDKYGISLGEAVFPLLGAGLAPVWMPSSLGLTTHPLGRRMRFISPDELRRALVGRRGIVVVTVAHEGERYGHALAWDGARAFDCSNCPDAAREQAPLVEALLLLHQKEG